MRMLACLCWAILAGGTTVLSAVPGFVDELLFTESVPIVAITAGVLAEGHPPQVVALLADGRLVLYTPPAGPEASWIREEAGQVPTPSGAISATDRPTLSVGEIMGSAPGTEVVVGSPSNVHVLYRGKDGLELLNIVDESGFVSFSWGARAGDYLPSRPGDEVFYIRESPLDFSAGFLLQHDEGTSFTRDLVYSAQVGMDSVAGKIGAADTPLAFVGTEMRPIWEMMPEEPTGTQWIKRDVYQPPDIRDAPWVMKIGDVDRNAMGNELVFGTRYSNRIVVGSFREGCPYYFEHVLTGRSVGTQRANMIDIALGDVLPDSGRQEILGVDASGAVYLVYFTRLFSASLGWETDEALHAVATADLDADRPGDEAVVGGEAGKLFLLRAIEGVGTAWRVY